jgi:hypothetical protein
MRGRRPESPGSVAMSATGTMSMAAFWQIASQVPQPMHFSMSF